MSRRTGTSSGGSPDRAMRRPVVRLSLPAAAWPDRLRSTPRRERVISSTQADRRRTTWFLHRAHGSAPVLYESVMSERRDWAVVSCRTRIGAKEREDIDVRLDHRLDRATRLHCRCRADVRREPVSADPVRTRDAAERLHREPTRSQSVGRAGGGMGRLDARCALLVWHRPLGRHRADQAFRRPAWPLADDDARGSRSGE